MAAIVERHGREALCAAVIRETREETAWAFAPQAISGIYLWQHPDKGERFLRVVFCGSCHDHDASQALDDGILRSLWLSRDELAGRHEHLRSPMVLRAIDDYLTGVRYPVNMFQPVSTSELAALAQVI